MTDSISWQARLAQSDSNRDGKISKSEYLAFPPISRPIDLNTISFKNILKRTFQKIDINKDGQLVENEILNKESTTLQDKILQDLLAKQIAKSMMEKAVREETPLQITSDLDELKFLLNSA